MFHGNVQRRSSVGVRRIAVRVAGHPLPDARGLAAAAEVETLLGGLRPDDVVLVLVSGGASALLPAPVAGVTLADKAEVQLAYAIGVAEPVSVLVETFGTGKLSSVQLTELVRKNFALTPKGIIESLDLRRPIYQKTAAYGHFGRTEPEFTWEATGKAAILAEQAGLVAAAK